MLLPAKSLTILETIANLGLLYAIFIQALQAEPTPISHTRAKMLFLSFLVFVLPLFLGCALYIAFERFIMEEATKSDNPIGIISIYWGTTITATGFATLAPILAKLKLLCTQVGQEALFVGLFNSFCTWGLINITLAISTSPNDHNRINFAATSYVLLFMVLYMALCCTVIKTTMSKIATNVPEGQMYSNFMVQMILFLVLACGVLTDYVGSHFIFGAYILGRSIPPGILAKTIIEKMEDCVDSVLMPLYFMVIGIKVDIMSLVLNFKYIWVIVLAVATKVLCTLLVGVFCKVPLRDGLPLGVLLSSKGILPLVLLNIGRERGVLTGELFTMLFFVIFLSTILVGPIMSISYIQIKKPTQSYDERSIESSKFSEKLRLITCIHSSMNVPSIINLLEISNITNQHPALVHITHLVELIGHASAMLVEHKSQDSFLGNLCSKLFFDRARAQSEHVIKAFDVYKDQQHDMANTTFKFLTIVSPVHTMHGDICSLAEDKEISLIVLPFHKQQGVDGELEDTNVEFGGVNQNVLDMAPCSVALLVDRGLRMLSLSSTSEHSLGDSGRSCEDVHIAMVYLGGPDDREALSYAWRMVGHSYVNLTVIRFLEGNHVMDVVIDFPIDYEKEKQMDDEFLLNFQEETCYDASISYLENVVNNGEEIIELLRDMNLDINLYIVGRGAKDGEGAEPGSPHNSYREEESGPAQNQVAQEVREGDSDSDAHPHEDDADETTMETGSPAQNNNETGGTSTGTDERIGSTVRQQETMRLQSCVQKCDLQDMASTGNKFTWNNKQMGENKVLCKLDRTMVNQEWLDQFPTAVTHFLSEGQFYHSPTVIMVYPNIEIVRSSWNIEVQGTLMFKVVQKLKNTKKALKRLNREGYSDIQSKDIQAYQKLIANQEQLQRTPRCEEARRDEYHAAEAYRQIHKSYLEFLTQKAKMQWCRDGDENSAVFHQSIKARRLKNTVYAINDSEGQWKDNPQDGWLDMKNQHSTFSRLLSVIVKSKRSGLKKRFMAAVFSGLVYQIWWVRNEAIWNHVVWKPEIIFKKLKLMVQQRIRLFLPQKISTRDQVWIDYMLTNV
ncbi:hypothetical protein BVRB_003070 [Beta vulgaris subsp. vulgaris]|uniref:Uncharacterized protein n=1 Tax=Beta vulgaris subsp. vulgaris TaxID=3555 RepID=A0A0J8B4U8_BETVV|nr:hypothetical protein BVRB_003070 [Beta vulgaris subsp. vulgaris]